MGGLLQLVLLTCEEETGRRRSPPRPLLAVGPTNCSSPPINGQCTNYNIAVYCSAVLMCFKAHELKLVKNIVIIITVLATECNGTVYLIQ